MTLSALAVAGAVLLGAEAPAGPSAAPGPLPRSSIAAVLVRRADLGLSDAEVSELERRDEALQRQVAELREQSAAASSHRQGGSVRAGARADPPPDGHAPPLPPTATALPDGSGGGHRGGFGGGGHHGGAGKPSGGKDAAARAPPLQSRLDDADTAAWLSAETVLAESRREKARDVAEKYREQLADRREAERAKEKR